MTDKILRMKTEKEISRWTCPSCEKECDVEVDSLTEIRECAETGIEYEGEQFSVDTCKACCYKLDHFA